MLVYVVKCCIFVSDNNNKKNKAMKTLRNSDKFATIINKGDYGFTVNFGYTACNEDTCTGRKVYKTEKAAQKFTDKYLN